jgi:hypothetical protein
MTRTELEVALKEQGVPTHDMEAAIVIWNLAIDAAHDTAVTLDIGVQAEGQWLYSDSVQRRLEEQHKIYE